MAQPNGGLITETNQQYYAGAQGFTVSNPTGQTDFKFTFDTDLVFGNFDPANIDYAKNNFKLYSSPDALTYTEYVLPYNVEDNTVKLAAVGGLPVGHTLVCQLKTITGGNYGNKDAYGMTVEQNYGGYAYITVKDLVNNFMVAYVGQDKIIPRVDRTDVIFHTKRGLQEFSYDTLKSIKSQELTVPHNLSLALPQDYVNYVRISRIDALGVQHILYPTNNLTDSPYEMPLQDNLGQPTQDNFGENTEGTSITEERWKRANTNLINQNFNNSLFNQGADWWGYDWGYGGFWYYNYGELYGMEPQYAQVNGWFNMNEREGKISFSSNLKGQLVIIEYISDGLAYDLDSRIPKLAEEAMYQHLLYSILSTRTSTAAIAPQYKKQRYAALRNAKIRLSNIKLDEIAQVMRGKSKWIKR